MNNWIVNWCQEKVSSNDNVESIEIIDDNHVEIRCQNSEVYNVAVISESYITMDLIEKVIKDNTQFLFNIKKEPLIEGEVLAYAEVKRFGIGGFGDIMRAINNENLTEYQNPETKFIMEGLKQHTNVYSIIRLDNRRYKVIKIGFKEDTILALNNYDLTAEKVREAKSKYRTFDVILASNPNARISSIANDVAKELGLKILTWRQLLGRLNS
ncbi:hypothetical protein AACT_2289 [Arcobacter acticola]|jgi:hypothetical protein|uniref:Uncharacterized protein n=1 Tax=Arcobacter acticola TaxID=1849015 RepID=A0A6M8EFN6_9BACT|nr:hypothetical protein [Arcobacter acticola]QKE29410.1 hypothetical protein AACT_2289 [Arcobacter acticola]